MRHAGLRGVASLCGLLALCGCDRPSDTIQPEQYRARIMQLENQLIDARVKLDMVDAQVQELDSQVDRLDSEDWSTVVPDLKDARDEVVAAKDEAVEAVKEQ